MKYRLVVHLFLGGAVVLILDVQVESKGGGVLLLAVVEAALEFLVKLIFGPPDEAASSTGILGLPFLWRSLFGGLF
jgi:hypothetical protein